MPKVHCSSRVAPQNNTTVHVHGGTEYKLVYAYVLQVNNTHIIYENSVYGKVNSTEGLISRQRRFNLQFACVYPLSYNVSMDEGIHTLTRYDFFHP